MKTSAHKDETFKNQPSYTVEWNDTTIPSHHPYILCHLAKCACCVHRRVVEGSDMGSAC